jgi:hypothetical protein
LRTSETRALALTTASAKPKRSAQRSILGQLYQLIDSSRAFRCAGSTLGAR